MAAVSVPMRVLERKIKKNGPIFLLKMYFEAPVGYFPSAPHGYAY